MTLPFNRRRPDDDPRRDVVRIQAQQLKQVTAAELLRAVLPPREHLLEGLMKTGESAMLWAAPGVGKTMASLSIALAVAGGGSWLHWAAPVPRRVLIVDGEMNVHDLTDRLRGLAKGAAGGDTEVALANINVLARQHQHPDAEFPDLADRLWQDHVLQMAQDWEADLIILDNFSTLAKVEDENSASAMAPILAFLMRLKSAEIGTILVHHSGKSGESFRGSSNIAATFEVIAGLKNPKDAAIRHGTAFDLSFDKIRSRRGASHVETTAWIAEDATSGALKWDMKKSDAAVLNQVVAAVQAEAFGFDKDIAKFLDMPTSTFGRWKDKAIAKKLITVEEWNQCLASGKAAKGGATVAEFALDEATDDADETDF